jgi:hypothetical protein
MSRGRKATQFKTVLVKLDVSDEQRLMELCHHHGQLVLSKTKVVELALRQYHASRHPDSLWCVRKSNPPPSLSEPPQRPALASIDRTPRKQSA